MKDFLAGQYRMLRLFAGIRPCGMSLWRWRLNRELAVLARFGKDRLA
jgi:hypothetical protein